MREVHRLPGLVLLPDVQSSGLRVKLRRTGFHVLLEVPPMSEEGISDEELFARLAVFYSEVQVAEIVREMEEAGSVRERGEFELPPTDDASGQPMSPSEDLELREQQAERRREEIRSRYTRRMHDLSEFMKSLLERFCLRSSPATPSVRASSGALFQDAA